MRTFYKGPLGEHGTGHDGPDAPSIMNDADLAEAGRHRVDAEPPRRHHGGMRLDRICARNLDAAIRGVYDIWAARLTRTDRGALS